MAMAERLLAERFNRPGHTVVDHRTWAFVSDGDLMEGVASEACSLAGHLALGKLALVYDDNRITIDGETALSFSEEVGARFEGYGWRVLRVDDGNDIVALDRAYADVRESADRPTLIILRTVIADPAPTKRNTAEAHGAPLGKDEVARTKQILGWPEEPFHVPAEVAGEATRMRARGDAMREEWQAAHAAWTAAHAELAAQLTDGIARLMNDEAVYAYRFTGKRFDCGSKIGYLQANVEYALAHPELASSFKAYIKKLAKDL
jgi:transketolase